MNLVLLFATILSFALTFVHLTKADWEEVDNRVERRLQWSVLIKMYGKPPNPVGPYFQNAALICDNVILTTPFELNTQVPIERIELYVGIWKPNKPNWHWPLNISIDENVSRKFITFIAIHFAHFVH
jgi:hypothetical protein